MTQSKASRSQIVAVIDEMFAGTAWADIPTAGTAMTSAPKCAIKILSNVSKLCNNCVKSLDKSEIVCYNNTCRDVFSFIRQKFGRCGCLLSVAPKLFIYIP